jgi:hypothetical protein
MFMRAKSAFTDNDILINLYMITQAQPDPVRPNVTQLHMQGESIRDATHIDCNFDEFCAFLNSIPPIAGSR